MPAYHEFDVTPATAGDITAAGDLFTTVFGAPPRPGLWHRKYFENPAGPPACFVAKVEGAVVSFAALHATLFSEGGRRFLLYQYGDSMTAREYRRRGVFSKLKRFSREWLVANGIPVIFSFPNANMRPLDRELGYTLLGRMTRWVKPVLGRPRRPTGVEEARVDDERIRDLWLAASHSSERIAGVRDGRFFRWRYGDAARVWFSNDGGAYAVTQDSPRGVWVRDLGVKRGAAAAFSAVCAALASHAADAGVRHISFPRLGAAYASALLSNGFMPLRGGAPVMIEAATSPTPAWMPSSRWHLTDADRDLDTRAG